GGARRAAAVTLPPEAVVVVPGYGEATFAEAARLPGPMLRAAAANALGAWVDRYAVVEADALARAVDRAGGLTIRLPDGPPAGTPSPVRLSGEQLLGFLSGRGQAADLRWRAALGALLGRPVLGEADLAEADDRAAAVEILRAAEGAEVVPLPTRRLADALVLPDLDAVDALAARLFGAPDGGRVRVAVWNGSGTPGVGRLVAERLIPAGFRIVLSENADAFGHRETVITAVGREHRADAERARELLGVGKVEVQRVSSGFSDLGIVVGEDLG
ncbi:MAG TPA: LytR C-terminal domain-containing protein, partial [Actinomycetota bacterium]|nr:LytR C-terminal domain-containing protein [Actinomycetota bacterium]